MNYLKYNHDKLKKRIKLIVNKLNINPLYKNFIYVHLLQTSRIFDLERVFFTDKAIEEKINKILYIKLISPEYIFFFKNNKIKINKFFYRFFKLIYQNFFEIFIIFFSLFKKKKKLKNTFDIIFFNSKVDKNIRKIHIDNFLKENLFFNDKNKEILFQSNINLFNKNYILTKNVLLYIAINYLDKSDRVKILAILIKKIFCIYKIFTHSSLLLIVYEKLSDLEFYKEIKDKNIIGNIFFFNTSIQQSHLWMFAKKDKIKKNLIFDSANMFYKYSCKSTYNPHSAFEFYKYMNFDKYFFPEKLSSKLLKFFGKINYKYYKVPIKNLFNNKTNFKSKNNLCLFGINAKTELPYILRANLPKNLVGNIKDIWNINYIILFYKIIFKVINDINTISNNKINCLVKLKESNSLDQKKVYLMIKKLSKKYNFIRLLGDNEDLSNIFNHCKTVISFPYTSPSHLFINYTKKQSIYFDSTGILKKNFKNRIILNNNYSKLNKKLKQLFKINEK